jgi:hypothetical protein
MLVTNGIPLGCSLLLLVGTVNRVQTLKVIRSFMRSASINRTSHTLFRLGTLLVFEHNFALDDVIGFHACSLEVSKRMTIAIPLGCPLPLSVRTLYDATTLKVL